MNGINQHQRHATVQIAGIIQNYRKVTTRTGKPMAGFKVGTFPAKCFDVLVDTAEHWAVTGKRVLVAGHLSNHDGTIELVAESINLAPSGQSDAQTGFSQGGHADISAESRASLRETSTITENLSGSVTNMRSITTQSGRPMITFRVGNISCKAFGDLASAIHRAEGKQIEVSARKGSFQGVTEYAVEILKTVNGTAVDLKDKRTLSPGECIGKTAHAQEAVNPLEVKDSDAFELLLEKESGPASLSFKGIVTTPDLQLPVNPGQEASQAEQAEQLATIQEHSSAPGSVEKHGSGMSASTLEALIQQKIRSYRNAGHFPDQYLEKYSKSGSLSGAEAARRVLEERARQKAEHDRLSEDFVQVEAA